MVTPNTETSALAAVKAGLVFAQENWRLLLPAILVYALASAYGHALTLTEADPAVQLRGTLITGLVGLCVAAAMLRKSVRNETSGLWGLDFGRDELRLLGAGLLVYLCTLVIGIVFCILVFSLITSGVDIDPISDPELFKERVEELFRNAEPAAILSGLLTMIGIALLIWVGTRLSLYSACTIGLERIALAESWYWTRSHVWILLGSYCLVILLMILPFFIIIKFLPDAESLKDAGQWVSWLFGLPFGVLEGTAIMIGSGVCAYFYQRLTPQAGTEDS